MPVRRIEPGQSGIAPESPAAIAAQRLIEKRAAAGRAHRKPRNDAPSAHDAAVSEHAGHKARLAKLKADELEKRAKPPGPARVRPGQGAKRCGRCGGDWVAKGTGRGCGSYSRICVGCNLEVKLCDCPPQGARIQKNAAHLESRNKNQRAVRAGTKPPGKRTAPKRPEIVKFPRRNSPRGGAPLEPPNAPQPRETTEVQVSGIHVRISIDVPAEQLERMKRTQLESLLDGIASIVEAKGGKS